MSRDRVLRIGLWVIAVPEVILGVWAGFFPRSFYDDFPGFGESWVSVDGPFNEHLVRDVGWFNLALALVTIAAAVVLTRALVGAALGATVVAGAPHFVYHANHLESFDTANQVLLLASLAFGPVLAIVLLALIRPGARGAAREVGGKIPASSTPTGSSSSNM